MSELYIPTLHTFAMENTFTGSMGLFRFVAEPTVIKATPKEVDFEKSTIRCRYWHGLFCLEKSSVEGEQTFPLTEAGREEMIAWLKSKI